MYVIRAVNRGEIDARSFAMPLIVDHNDLFHITSDHTFGLTDNCWVVPVPGFFDLIA